MRHIKHYSQSSPPRRNRLPSPAVVVAALALLASLSGLAELAQAATGPSTYTAGPGGVTVYVPSQPLTAHAFASLRDNSGTVVVTDWNSAQREIASYTVSVLCTSYLPNGVVYWGGKVTSGTFSGRYLFGRLSAGGANVGTMIGELTPKLTCYDGSNGGVAGPPAPALAPQIVVNARTHEAYTAGPGGVTVYVPSQPLTAHAFASLRDNSGTVVVTDWNSAQREIASYTVSVLCTSYLPNGVVYWGGKVTSGTFSGRYLFGRLSAGGANVGTMIGELTPKLTCYDGSNERRCRPPAPALAPQIVVNSGSRTL